MLIAILFMNKLQYELSDLLLGRVSIPTFAMIAFFPQIAQK